MQTMKNFMHQLPPSRTATTTASSFTASCLPRHKGWKVWPEKMQLELINSLSLSRKPRKDTKELKGKQNTSLNT